MATTEKLRTLSGGRECEPLLEAEGIAWGRTGDLVVGVVEVAAQDVSERMKRAYDLLDEAGVLRPHELWSVVLVVIIAGTQPEAAAAARNIERDLRRSRKIAVLGQSPLPNLFAGIGGQELHTEEPPADVVSSALDEAAAGHVGLRALLDVMLKAKRPPEEVEKLIDALGMEPAHG